MNIPLLTPVRKIFNIRIPLLGILLLLISNLYAQNIAIVTATGGLVASPIPTGISNVSVFGVELQKAGGGTRTVTGLTFATTSDPNGKFTNPRLYSSIDATFSGVGVETLIAGGVTGTLNATDISFSGGTITDFGGASGATSAFIFLVVDVTTGASGNIQPSLASTGVATAATVTGSTITGTNYAFTAAVTTIANLSTGLAASPLLAGSTGLGVYGFSLTSTGGQSVTAINIQVTSTAVGKWGNYSLITSTDNSFATTGDNSAAIGGLSFDPSSGTQIAITGLSQSITTSTKNFFLVVDVNGAVNGGTTAVQPSVAGATNITFGTGTGTGTATGTNYSFVAPLTTIANLSTGLAASPLVAGSTGQGVFGFSLTSTGTQSVTAINIQVTSTAVGKWGNYSLITSTDNSFATTGDNSAAIGGLSFDPSSGTQIAITGLSQSITTSTTNFFLVVDVNAAVNAATTAVQPSVAGATNITFGTGTGAGTATGTSYSFSPLLTIANLSTGLAGSPLFAGSTGQGVFGFSLTSSGTQTVTVINVQVSSTAVSKWGTYSLITSTDNSFATTGDNSAAIGGLSFDASSGTQIAITGLSQVITSGTNYFLIADVNAGVTGATTAIQPSLVPANITVSTGGKTGTATGTNYSFGTPTATFAQLLTGIATSPLSAGAASQAVLGFSASSNASQAFTAINIQVTNTPVSKWGSYSLVRSTDASFATSGDNTTVAGGINFSASATQIAITGISTETLTSIAKNYFLVVTVDPAVTSSTIAVQPSFTQANISVSPGTPASVTVTGTNYSFNTSQLSDITLVSGPTNPINYRTHQAASINDTDTNLSLRLAQFQIRDGAGSADGDDKVTSITQITLNVTGFANLRQIALSNAATDVEIAGTEQTVGASNLITFIPSSPIRTGTDGGTFDFKVRVTWKAAVLDNDPVFVAIQNVVGETGFSGFASGNAGAATTSGAANKTVIVTATKFIFQPGPPGTSSINTNFGPITIKAVDGNPQNNKDLDYNGKLDLTISGGAGSLTGGGALTLAAGQVIVPNLQINQSGSYTLDAVDDDYTDAPDNQPDLGDPSAAITITSSASTITQPSALNLCFGGSFQALGNIVLTETDPSGFSNSGSFAIGLPSGFVFDTGTNPTLTMSNSTTTFTNVGFTGGNIVQFDYSIASPTGNNALTIAGLKIRYPGNTVPGGGNLITRSGGTATMAGITAGTQLGTVNATLGTTPPSFGFTVLKVNPGDVDVNPGETRFSQGSNAVRLVPSHGTTAGVDYTFTGPGVTLISGQYRFNPQSLSPSPPLYDIVYTFTEGTPQACQFTATKSFEVYTTNISGLLATYCNNSPASTGLDVTSYMSTFYPTFTFLRFVYWNTPGGRLTDGTISVGAPPGPVNLGNTLVASTTFDPKLAAYQPVYSATGSVYGTIGLWIGFEITGPGPVTFIIWQLIPVRPAPSPTFTFGHLPTFCEDEPSVVLTGTPPNSNTITDDFFTATLVPSGTPPVGTVTSSVANPKVWSFDPGSLGAGQVDITYTYRDPSTTCTATSPPIRLTVNSRPSSVTPLEITSGVSLQTCQGVALGTFTAAPLTVPNEYRWYEDANLTILRGSGNTFAPPNPPANPNVAGTTNFYVTKTIAGCESNKQPVAPPPALSLSVIVNSTPGAPVPNFNRDYCVGDVITASDLQIGSGSFIKWYQVGNPTALLTNVSSPNASQISTNLGISTAAANVYSFDVTQTVSLCEGLINPTRIVVTIKAKPAISISASVADPNKICTTGGVVQFTALDQGGLADNGTWTGIGTSGIPNPIPTQGKLDLNPLTGLPGPYTLTYTYTNAGGCSNFGTIGINILPVITPVVSVGNVCNGFPATVINNSTVSTGGVIAQAKWVFGDGKGLDFGSGTVPPGTNGGVTTGTYFNPQQVYPITGLFQLSGVLRTSDGCDYNIPSTPVTVSPLPKIDFSWTDPCKNGTSSTVFTAIERTTPTPIAIATYQWNFNVNNSLTYTSAGSGSNPTVNYNKDGADEVELLVTTPQGCQDTKKKPIYIVPSYSKITPTNAYNQAFDAGVDGWVTGGLNSSWTLGTPNETVIKGASSGANAWFTNLVPDQSESSWVLSPCFVFKDATVATNSTKPVISIDIWSNTPRGVDGAVLQYNVNGNIENDNNWVVLGTVGSGVNWYDDQGISNSPGNQASGDLGWTGDISSSGGKYSTYQKAIFKLDNLLTAPKDIIFRIAFASAQSSKDGFAFDNVFIGERSRVVLLESFTNTSSAGVKNHNDIYRAFGNSTGELVKIQYHTPFPGDDALNALNTQMNNSRAAFYGITSSPAARVDGDFVSGNIANWLSPFYDDRVLTPSLIKLDVTAVKTGSTVKISTTITNNSGQSVPLAGAHIFTTVVEKSIVSASLLGNSGNSEFVYVAKQMLPTSTGLIIPSNLGAGQTYTAPDVIWENNTGDAIAVFVQSVEGNNKNVFQSILLNNPPQPDVVTGLGDLLLSDKISIYPNPADEEMTIQLPSPAPQRLQLQMVDQVGRVVNEHFIAEGERSKTISTRDLAGGIYLLQLGSGNTSTRKKIMVVHGK